MYSSASAPPLQTGVVGRLVGWLFAFLVWVGDLVWWKWHRVTVTTMFKGPLPVGFNRWELWSFCFWTTITVWHHRLSVRGDSDMTSLSGLYLKRLVGGVTTTWGMSDTQCQWHQCYSGDIHSTEGNEKREGNGEWNQLQQERELAWGNKLCIPAHKPKPECESLWDSVWRGVRTWVCVMEIRL